MAVHSAQLGRGQSLGVGPTTLYTVPAGKRAIVKSYWARNHGTAQTSDFQLVISGGPTLDFFVPLAATPAAGSTVFASIWVVLNPGDQIRWISGASQLTDVIVSGTELTL